MVFFGLCNVNWRIWRIILGLKSGNKHGKAVIAGQIGAMTLLLA
jgi:hypothetical protein